MPDITFREKEQDITVSNPLGGTILAASLQGNVPHYHACNGHARCTTCRVWVVNGRENLNPRTDAEKKVSSRKHWPDEIRLACQTKIFGDVTVKRLVTDDDDMELVFSEDDSPRNAEERPLVVMACQTGTFNGLIENHLPYDLFHLLSRYYKEIAEVVVANQGYLERYRDGGLIALFGLENDDSYENCLNAVRASLRIRARLTELNKYAADHFGHTFPLSIALHYGPILVGEVWHPLGWQMMPLGKSLDVVRCAVTAVGHREDVTLLASSLLVSFVASEVQIGQEVKLNLSGVDYPFYPIVDFKQQDTNFWVQSTFERIGPGIEIVTSFFYDRLFELNPSLKDLFRYTDMRTQRKMLTNMLGVAIRGGQMQDTGSILQELGGRHVDYGVKMEDYALAGEAFLYALQRYFGTDFTPEIRQAWATTYTTIVQTMTERPELEMTPATTTAAIDQILARLQSYIPKELAEKIGASGHIEGERRQVTVVFADISGFTALSERFDPEEVASMANDALQELTVAVYQYDGYVDKFMGDSVMAVFGAPTSHEDDPERALYAALTMRERLVAFNERWQERLGEPLSFHIGVNTGAVIAGSIGSDLRMSYTVMGDTVNIASRLESLAKPGQILIGPMTYRLTQDTFNFIPLGQVTVKGKREPLVVYELKGVQFDI